MSEVTTDHKTIRKWAESHGGRPAAVDRTHHPDDVGIIRLMFPKSPRSEHDHLVEISWDEFFKEFDERKLALIYDRDGMFSKLVSRDSAKERAHS
jgi:anaerobic selenocysteine-containing dehydrogenase